MSMNFPATLHVMLRQSLNNAKGGQVIDRNDSGIAIGGVQKGINQLTSEDEFIDAGFRLHLIGRDKDVVVGKGNAVVFYGLLDTDKNGPAVGLVQG